MDVTWMAKYVTEFLGTAILIILGNGAVANVELKGTGNHINPAFTLGLAVSGYFEWGHVAPYIAAQILGAIFGQALVVATHRPYYLQTTNPNAILGSFSTISSIDHGTPESRKAATINGFVNEFVGSFVLFFAAIAMTKNYFGAEIVKYAATQGIDASSIQGKAQVGHYIFSGLAVSHLALGFLVMALVTSLGGPTGPGLNPARDLGPRILHEILPKSVLGEHKGDSKWWYSWVPVVAPILAGITAVMLYKFIYG